jgi:hypothetical protein
MLDPPFAQRLWSVLFSEQDLTSRQADQMLDPPFSHRLWSVLFSEQDRTSRQADQMLDPPFSQRLWSVLFSEQDLTSRRAVNLAATIPGWTRFPAAEEWLRNWLAIHAKGEEADFKQFMSEQATKPSTERTGRLFQEFQI